MPQVGIPARDSSYNAEKAPVLRVCMHRPNQPTCSQVRSRAFSATQGIHAVFSRRWICLAQAVYAVEGASAPALFSPGTVASALRSLDSL